MKKYYPQILSVTLLLAFLLPVVAFAVTINGVDFGNIIPCDGVTVPCDFAAFAQLINNIINWFITISASVAACTFAYAGAQMLLHPDEPAKKEDAKNMFWKTLIGLLWILGAWLLLHVVIGALVGSSTGALRYLQS